jgi:hypothetical protein
MKTPLPLIGLSDFVSGWAMLLAPLSAEFSRHKLMTAYREPQSKRSIKHFSVPTCLDHLAGPKAYALLLRLAQECPKHASASGEPCREDLSIPAVGLSNFRVKILYGLEGVSEWIEF